MGVNQLSISIFTKDSGLGGNYLDFSVFVDDTVVHYGNVHKEDLNIILQDLKKDISETEEKLNQDGEGWDG